MTDAPNDLVGPGRVAVVTGAASGIGRALAMAFADEGSIVMVGDIDGSEAEGVAAGIRDGGGQAEALTVNVADAASVEDLAAHTLARFGRVDVLCNNAGVSTFNLIQDQTLDDWRWVFDVNLWGVVHGLQSFLPVFRRQGTPAHIVNTASIAGLIVAPFLGPYNATKQAVVAISETLFKDLQTVAAPVGVSVLCPGFVQTRIAESERNRPDWAPDRDTMGAAEVQGVVQNLVDGGIAPATVAERVIDAVRTNTFYILTHPELDIAITTRFDDIVQGRAPSPTMIA
jgi:NAD(P)-dependent dehydrogenase (short-subunit alcohol dehydrogenase family)